MPEIAYLFERFPSFGQTFCYREVAELERQGTKVHVYSIRRPVDEPKQDWDQELVGRVHFLPEESALVREVDRARFHPADFGSSVPAIVSIGRLIEKKGFADLIEACRLLKPRGRPFACEIIGEGPLEAALRAQIAEAGLESCVKLAGPLTQSEIVSRVELATIFVLPCTREADGGME